MTADGVTADAVHAVRDARPLRIAHTESSRGWGGQEIRVLTEAAGMAERGHDVMVYAPADAPIVREGARFGVRVQGLPIGRKAPGGMLAVRRALRSRPVDVVNTHSSTDTWLVALACTLMQDAPALVRTRHVSVPVPDNAATRWLYRRATTRVVTTGDSLREQLVRENGIAPSRVDSVPTGMDPVAFVGTDQGAARAQCGLPDDVPLIGIIATLRSWKGHRHMLDALPRLAHDDARLVLVGDGPQRAALAAQVATLGLQDRVIMAGQQEDVVPWLAAIDVLVLPSYANEGVPQALLQAMFARVPVVTTDVGGIPEIATHEVTALVVPREDPRALALAIDRLLEDPLLNVRLVEDAHALVSSRYTRGAMLDRMESVFRRAIDQRGSGAGDLG